MGWLLKWLLWVKY